jgi:hypothetical protein
MYSAGGLRERQDGSFIPELCKELIDGGGGANSFDASLRETLSKPGFPIGSSTYLKHVIEEQILPIGASSGAYAIGTPAGHALQAFLFRLFTKLGILKRYPVALEYRPNPELTFDDVVDRVISSWIVWPTLADIKGESARFESLKSILPTIIRQWSYFGQQRSLVADGLRRYLSHIGYKLVRGLPIDEAEKTFFLAFSDQSSQRARLSSEKEALPQLPAVENADRRVDDLWNIVKASCESGPFLKFGKFVSNGLREALTFYYGPQSSAMGVSVGYRQSLSYFVSFKVETVETLSWSVSDQLESARDRYAGVYAPATAGYNVGPVQPPVVVAVPGTSAYAFHLDLPNVSIRMHAPDSKSASINQYDLEWFSNERNRVVSTREGYTSANLMYELALSATEAGDARTAGKELTHWTLIDLEKSSGLGDMFSEPSYMEEVFRPSVVTREVVRETVNMSDYYSRMGTLQIKAPFLEYVLAPNSWLDVPDPGAEQFIVARLNLTREDQIRSEKAIRFSHNRARLMRLLGPASIPAMDVKRVVSAMAGF